jgi:CheY-like chemotaxis protein
MFQMLPQEKSIAKDQLVPVEIAEQDDSCVCTVRRICIVEDTDDIRDLLCEVFQDKGGYEVRAFPSGEKALALLQMLSPQLFLLDYHLPGMNGLELIDQLRKIKGYEQIPVLLMSACTPAKDLTTRQHLRYIRKPFDLIELLEVTEELLDDIVDELGS